MRILRRSDSVEETVRIEQFWVLESPLVAHHCPSKSRVVVREVRAAVKGCIPYHMLARMIVPSDIGLPL